MSRTLLWLDAYTEGQKQTGHANALELHLFCMKPLILSFQHVISWFSLRSYHSDVLLLTEWKPRNLFTSQDQSRQNTGWHNIQSHEKKCSCTKMHQCDRNILHGYVACFPLRSHRIGYFVTWINIIDWKSTNVYALNQRYTILSATKMDRGRQHFHLHSNAS